jgi:hypothetical protein
VPREAKRFRHVAMAIPKVLRRGIAVSPRQQPDVKASANRHPKMKPPVLSCEPSRTWP